MCRGSSGYRRSWLFTSLYTLFAFLLSLLIPVQSTIYTIMNLGIHLRKIILFFFIRPSLFRTWAIMSLHNFLSSVALSKTCLFVISPKSYSANLLHKLILLFHHCAVSLHDVAIMALLNLGVLKISTVSYVNYNCRFCFRFSLNLRHCSQVRSAVVSSSFFLLLQVFSSCVVIFFRIHCLLSLPRRHERRCPGILRV